MATNYIKLKNVPNAEIDLRTDTATESVVLQGITFHKSNGEIATGTYVPSAGSSNPYEDIIDNQYGGEEYQGQHYAGVKGTYLFAGFDGDNTAFASYYTPSLKAKFQTPKGSFFGCSLITSIDLSNLLTSYQYLDGLECDDTFGGCQSLASLNFSNTIFDYNTYAQEIKSARGMFFDCEHLTNIDLRDTKFATGADFTNMFKYDFRITSIQFPSSYTANPYFADDMFSNCQSLTSLDLSDNISWYNIYSANRLFAACINLANLTLHSSFMYGMRNSQQIFYRCDSLTDIYVNGTKNDWKNGNYYGIFGDCQINQTITVHTNYDNGYFIYTWNVDHYEITESLDTLYNGYYINDSRTDSFYLDADHNRITYNGVNYNYTQEGNGLIVDTLGYMYIAQANQSIEYNHSYYQYYAQLYTLQDGTYSGTDGLTSWTIDSANATATDENGNTYPYTYGSGTNTITINTVVYWLWGSDAFSNNNVEPPIFYQCQISLYHLHDGQYDRTQGSGSNYYIIDTANSTAINSNNVTRTYVDNNDGTITMDKGGGKYETYILVDSDTFQNQAGTTIYHYTTPIPQSYILQDGMYNGSDGTSTFTFDTKNEQVTDQNNNTYSYTLSGNSLTINGLNYTLYSDTFFAYDGKPALEFNYTPAV